MIKLDDHSKIVLLIDFYGNLLTRKQYDIMDLYYNNDLSLAEIAENINISRQGVYDLLKRSRQQLEDLEKQLCHVERFTSQNARIDKLVEILNTMEIPVEKAEGAEFKRTIINELLKLKEKF